MRHADYFDPEGTGLIRYRQTFRGLRDLGVGRIWSAVLSTIINGALGWVTQGRPTMTIRIDAIARGKHPSDTGIFDEVGRFVPERFEALFASAEPDGAGRTLLTRRELRAFMHASGPQSKVGDFFSAAEAKLFFCVAADATKREDDREVPAISKRRLASFYAGDLLPALRRRNRVFRRSGPRQA
jgi:peroxygenase